MPEPQSLRLPFLGEEESETEKGTAGEIAAPAHSPDCFQDHSPLAELTEALIRAELNRSDAKRFAREQPEVCRRQLEFLPFVEKFTTSRGAYLRRAIEGDFGPPAAYTRQRQQQQEEQMRMVSGAQKQVQARAQEARGRHEEAHRDDFAAWVCQWVNGLETTHPEAFMAFQRSETQKRQLLAQGPLSQRPMTRRALETFDHPTVKADRVALFCRGEGHRFGLTLPNFWEWDAQCNTKPFSEAPT